MGQGPRCRSTSKMTQVCGRNEIDNYPVRRLTGAAETRLVLNGVHREPLMLQRFSHSCVDMLAKTRNRGSRRRFQHQWYNPGTHSRHRLCLRPHPPAYREIEHHFRTLDVAPAHQQRASRSNHRRSTHPQRLGQLADLGNDERVQSNGRRRLIRITPARGGVRGPIMQSVFLREVPCPIGLIIEIIGGRFVFQLAIDQITQRPKKGRRNRRAGSHCIIDFYNPMKD